eukprot:gene25684-biopygen24005
MQQGVVKHPSPGSRNTCQMPQKTNRRRVLYMWAHPMHSKCTVIPSTVGPWPMERAEPNHSGNNTTFGRASVGGRAKKVGPADFSRIGVKGHCRSPRLPEKRGFLIGSCCLMGTREGGPEDSWVVRLRAAPDEMVGTRPS